MKCPNCENSIDEKSEVCEWCGINIEAFNAEQEAEALRLAEERAASRKRNDARKQETGDAVPQNEPVSEKVEIHIDYPPVQKQHEAAKQRRFSRKKLIICSISGVAAIIGVLGLISFLRYPDRRYDEVFLIGDMVEVEYDFMYGVEKNGKRGVVSGLFYREIIPCIYDGIFGFSEGMFVVSANGKLGFLDDKGKAITSLKYDGAYGFYSGMAPVNLNGKWGFIDRSGYEKIPFKYDAVINFSEGLAPVLMDDKWGFINGDDKVVIPFQYDVAYMFNEGLACVVWGGRCGFIDKTGKEIIPFIYERASFFFDGYAAVEMNGKHGCIDKTGNVVIPIKYDEVRYFHEDRAAVKLDEKWGFVDRDGNEVIPCKYDFASDFYSDGTAHVSIRDENLSMDIDKKGECIKKY